MEFKKYSSIENSYRTKVVDYIRGYHPNEEFVVQEKIHGCLENRTKISMADGTTKTISDIVKNKITDPVLGVDVEGRVIETPITHHFDNGKTDDWLKITFSKKGIDRGKSIGVIRCTPNHRFFLDGEYVPAEVLKEGDFVTVKRKDLHISYVQREVLKGKMLGDGSLLNNSISFGHKKEHELYIDYTLELLQNIAGKKQKEQISGYGSTMCRARSVSNIAINSEFSNWFTKEGAKIVPKIKLSPISLAFWYMDDGSLSHHKDQNDRANFATNGFDERSIDNLLFALSELGIEGVKYQASGWRIRLNCDEADKMFTIISPYIPEVMQYKLPERYRQHSNIFRLENKAEYKSSVKKQEILKIEKCTDLSSNVKYDIETGTHNFFANGVLVHNSNFAFYVDRDGIKCAKRSSFLEDPASFFNADILLAKYEFALKAMFVNIQCDSLSVHGEIYGGNYPHKDVAKNICVSSVQKGVYYSPNREFIAFDMKIDGQIINIDSMNTILDEFGIPRSDLLLRGNLEECLAYPNEFTTLLPTKFGLPELDDNVCEGVVIKSVTPCYLGNGSRAILKNKNAKWSEKVARKPSKPKKEVPAHIKELTDIALTYVSENRLRNVLSKLGPITDQKTAFSSIMQPFNVDVIEDFTKENEKFLCLDKKERKVVTGAVNKAVTMIIRINLMNIIDGNF